MEPDGDMINHYKILEPIGKGGMGEVFLAEDTILGRKVAIKFLPENVQRDPQMRKRLLREARAAAALDHPNICQVYETGEAEGRSYIVMEYVAGETLKERMSRGPMPLMEVVEMACELAEALVEAHEKNIVHRDLKPANIILKPQGRPKIMDFGLAKQVTSLADTSSIQTKEPARGLPPPPETLPEEGETATWDPTAGKSVAAQDQSTLIAGPEPQGDLDSTTGSLPTAPDSQGGGPGDDETLTVGTDLTQEGTLIGTIAYMSPEQASCKPVDARSDIFAFGVVLYEMLSGKNPFHRKSQVQTLSAIVRDAVPTPESPESGSVPAALRNILNKAMAKDLAERYQSMKDMEKDLRDLRERLKRPKWVKWALSGAGVLVVGLIALAWWFAGHGAPPVQHAPVAVLIADFENSTGEDAFNDVLEKALEVGLEEAPFITSYQRTQARKDALEFQPESKGLDKETAQKVAQREGIETVLTGSIEKRRSGYRLRVEAVDPVSGDVTAEEHADADNKNDVFIEMAKLSVDLRRSLGDTEAKASEQLEKETFTSSSLEAAKSYVTSQDLQSAGKWNEAINGYLKAVRLDPEFGRAYAGIAVCYLNLVQPAEAQKYFNEAMKRIDRMTAREKHRTFGNYYLSKKNYTQAINEYGALVDQYPSDGVGFNGLAFANFYARDMAGAEEMARKSHEMDPSSVAKRSNLALFAMYAGDFDTADREAAEAIKQDPAYTPPYTCRALTEIINGNLLQAKKMYRSLAEISGVDAATAAAAASDAAMGLADLALYEGRVQEAVSLLEEGIAKDQADKKSRSAAIKLAALAGAYGLLDREAQAISAADKAVAASQLDRVLYEAAAVYVDAGRSEKALDLARILKAKSEPDSRAYARIIEAKARLVGGDKAGAIRLLESTWKEVLDCWLVRFELGKAYLEDEQSTVAYGQFDQCRNRRGETTALFVDDIPTLRYLPPLYYYLGRTQGELGSPQAADSYNTYISIKKAASEKDPLIEDARTRLGALK